MLNPSLLDYTGTPAFEVTLTHSTFPKSLLLDSLFFSPIFDNIHSGIKGAW